MRSPIFKLLVFQLIAFAALSVSGQNAKAQRACAEADYACQILDYNALIEANPKNADAYYARGYARIQLESYAAAIRDFNRVRELDPKNTNADVSLKYIYTMIKRGGLPVEEYDNLIQLEPTNAEYYFLRSKLQIKAKDFYPAIADLSKALELKPNYLEAYAARAYGYCEVDRWKEANADIAQADRLRGKSFNELCRINVEKSIANCAATDDDCKIEIYSTVIENPRLARYPSLLGDYYVNRGLVYFEREKFALAYSDFENAGKYSYQLKNKVVELYLGKTLLEKGEYNKALKHFERAGRDAEAYLGIGEIHFIKRNFDAAFENFEQAIFLNPRLSKAYLGRGTIYLERAKIYGEFENDAPKADESYRKAVRDFDSVIEIDLGNTAPEVYVKRAKAYERLGEQAKADADRAKAEEIAEKP